MSHTFQDTNKYNIYLSVCFNVRKAVFYYTYTHDSYLLSWPISKTMRPIFTQVTPKNVFYFSSSTVVI